jgi:RHS repeat-associated protein
LPQSALAADQVEGEGVIFLPVVANLASTEEAAPVEAAAVIPTVTFYHYDATGNLMALSEQNGGVIWRAAMRPFGNGTPTSTDYPLGFDGRLQEASLGSGGLYHLGARLYDPISGRFLSADPYPQTELPLEDPQYFNLYAYGLNNPYRFGDRTGLAPGSKITEKQIEKTGYVLEKLLDDPFTSPEARKAVIQAEGEFNHALYLLRNKSQLSPQQVRQAAIKLLDIHTLVTEGLGSRSRGFLERSLVRWNVAKLFKGKGGIIGAVIVAATVVPGVAEAASDDKYGTAVLEAISPFWPQDTYEMQHLFLLGMAPPNFGPPPQFDWVREFNTWWSEGLDKWLAEE